MRQGDRPQASKPRSTAHAEAWHKHRAWHEALGCLCASDLLCRDHNWRVAPHESHMFQEISAVKQQINVCIRASSVGRFITTVKVEQVHQLILWGPGGGKTHCFVCFSWQTTSLQHVRISTDVYACCLKVKNLNKNFKMSLYYGSAVNYSTYVRYTLAVIFRNFFLRSVFNG